MTLVHICVFFLMHVFPLDIPDDEAQYWTGKLERINTMGIHDEVTEINIIFSPLMCCTDTFTVCQMVVLHNRNTGLLMF